MRVRLVPVILLAACTDYELGPKDDVTEPPQDDTAVDCPPQIPDCRDSDSPVDSVDSVPEGPADCEVRVAEPGTVTINEECEGHSGGGTVTDPWNLRIEYQYRDIGTSVVMPAVGNLNDDNGDGKVDENDIPDIAFTGYSSSKLVALSGDGSGPLFAPLSGYRYDGGVVIADVDADGTPEIGAITSSGQIQAIDAKGKVEWTSATFTMQYPVMTVADLDADGMPEVIGDVGVVSGKDGSTIATLSPGNFWRAPVAADIDQDGTQEIILGNKVFDHTGKEEWSVAGTGTSAFSALADIDGDPEAEVFNVIGNTLWINESDGTLIRKVAIPGAYGHPGPPCMADFDGDGEVEIAIPEGSFLTVYDVDGTTLWSVAIDDSSGAAGCSGYDVDGDYAYEVLFADQVALRIYDGLTGTVLYENRNHGSVTYFEYPVIADMDRDGSAEIAVTASAGAYQGVTVFGHGGDGWNEAGPTWGVHDFGVTNINPDGSIPAVPEASWTKYNVFRARPVVDEPASGDLELTFEDLCVASCVDGPIKVSVQVQNNGGSDIEAGVMWAFYRVDGEVRTLVTTGVLPVVPAGVAIEGIELELLPENFGANGFVMVVDDDGTGAGAVNECDEENNELVWGDKIC